MLSPLVGIYNPTKSDPDFTFAVNREKSYHQDNTLPLSSNPILQISCYLDLIEEKGNAFSTSSEVVAYGMAVWSWLVLVLSLI